MKKRNKLANFILTIILSCCIFCIIGLAFHEIGHALMAICCKIPIKTDMLTYVEVNINNATDLQLALIALGSFIIPEIIYLLLFIFKNPYVTIFRIVTGMSLYSNIIIGIWILLIGTSNPEQYDILLFQQYANINSGVIILFLLITLVTNVIFEIISKRIANLIDYVFEKFM